MVSIELYKIIKLLISEKYNITVTDMYVSRKEYDKYYHVRYDYWTNDLKYIIDSVTYIYDKDILNIVRKMKLKNLEKL